MLTTSVNALPSVVDDAITAAPNLGNATAQCSSAAAERTVAQRCLFETHADSALCHLTFKNATETPSVQYQRLPIASTWPTTDPRK